jgi:succinylglutamic semialdehyde dehydrogenase
MVNEIMTLPLGIEVKSELVSYEPATGAEIWRGPVGNVEEQVIAARDAWPKWASKALGDRIEIIRKIAGRIRMNGDSLADLIARETGKPLWSARIEVDSCIAQIDVAIRAYADRTSQRCIDGKPGNRTALRHKPHGVLAVISAFNQPAQIPNGHIVPALIAGNAVIFKPSEKTPAVGAFLASIYAAAGIPDGVVCVLQGGAETGEALTKHNGIDGALFTGSSHTGFQLNRQFSTRPNKILALEMGANNPIIVWDTNDIHSAAVMVVQSAFSGAGQLCTAARRLVVKDSMADAVIAEVKRIADRLIIGAPHSSPLPFMGPLIDNETADGLTESFVALMSHGARPIKHMARPVAGRPFVTPGIIDVTQMAQRPDIELFGPLLQCVRVSEFAEAIAEANNTRFGLSASLLGGTAEQYNEFWSNSRAGITNWNTTTHGASPSAPFGGIGLSGNHRSSGYYAADYCAYPVVSSENEELRAILGIGLADEEYGLDIVV